MTWRRRHTNPNIMVGRATKASQRTATVVVLVRETSVQKHQESERNTAGYLGYDLQFWNQDCGAEATNTLA
jgi:hypothetical protein